MSVLRTIKCDICGATETEAAPGAGWPDWGDIHGIALDGVGNPSLCPRHLAMVADMLDAEKMKEGR